MQSVIETADYLSDAKAARLTDAERKKVIITLAGNPAAGDEIQGTGGGAPARFGFPVGTRGRVAAIE